MWRNVALLSLCQGLMMTANALMVTAAALVGYELASDETLATVIGVVLLAVAGLMIHRRRMRDIVD